MKLSNTQIDINANDIIHSIKIAFFTNGVMPDIKEVMLIKRLATEIKAVTQTII